MKSMVLAIAATAAHALAAYTVVTNDGAVVFSNSVKEQVMLTDPLLAEDGISSVEYNSNGSYYLKPTSPATYTGGTTVSFGQIYIKSSDALGPGVLTIKDYSSVIVDGGSVTFGHKVVFNPLSSYVSAINGGDFTLKSIGTEGADSVVRIGRAGPGDPSTGTLSLTDPGSEAVRQIKTSGNLDLTLDGGTLKARGDAVSPFFTSATAADTPKATVSMNGVTVDVAAGGDVYLGFSPSFARAYETNLIESAGIVDGSFESGLGGWTIDNSGNTRTASSVQQNNALFDTADGIAWTTANGSRYLMLRILHKAKRRIAVPSAGLWRIAFESGCRPGDNYYSLNMRTVVKVGGKVFAEFPQLDVQADRHGFKRFATDAFELEAGEYDLELSLVHEGNIDNIHYNSMNFDAFALEKVEVIERTGAIAKTGEGTLRLGGLAGGAALVSQGKFSFESGAIDNSSVVATGGELELVGASLADSSSISVDAGAKLSFGNVSGADLIVNGSFEAEGEYKNYKYKNPKGWSGDVEEETDLNGNGFGLQGNGGDVSPESDNGPYTPAGTVTAYLRENTSLRQSVAAPESGVYRLSFLKACRSRLYSDTMPMSVLVDGKEVLKIAGGDKYVYDLFSVDVALSAGEHVIKFVVGRPSTRKSAGAMIFIDDVKLRQVKSQGDIDGTIEMASGSTLHLGNGEKFAIRNFLVDGIAVTGRRAAAEAAGITVTGDGQVRFGEKQGMIIIAR